MRTLSEILKQADETKSILGLKALADELYENRFRYKVYEVSFGLEHIRDLGVAIGQKNQVEQLFK